MKKVEKEQRIQALQVEAKDLQARLGYLSLQAETVRKEIRKIRGILEFQEVQFNDLQRAPVDEEAP